MVEDGEQEYGRLIFLIQLSCKVFGYWPDPPINKNDAFKMFLHRLHQLFSKLATLIIALGATGESITLWGVDMNECIESSLVSTIFYMCLVRFAVLTIHQKDMEVVLYTMREDWKMFTEKERNIVMNKCAFTFKFTKFFILNVLILTGIFSLMPIIDAMLLSEGQETKKILPFRGYYYFFDYTTSPRYEITYALNFFMGMMGVATVTGVTNLSLVATMHAAAKFSIIKNEVQNLDWNSKTNIRQCVFRHQKCIEFAESVERLINILALAQFVISTGLVCFSGFQLTTMLNDFSRMIKYIFFLNTAIMELFIFSFAGQVLKSESEEFANCVYSSNWIVKHSSSLDIRLILLRATKPCCIIAGKFYDMCFESFLKVMSSSFSYFTVLLTMKE